MALVLVGILSNVPLFTAVVPVWIPLAFVLLSSFQWKGGADRTVHFQSWLRTQGRILLVSLLAAAMLGGDRRPRLQPAVRVESKSLSNQ